MIFLLKTLSCGSKMQGDQKTGEKNDPSFVKQPNYQQ